MDLFLTILRFLFGTPLDGDNVETIVAHSDGRTSSGRQWCRMQQSPQHFDVVSTLRQFCERIGKNLFSLFDWRSTTSKNDRRAAKLYEFNSRSLRN